MSLERAFRLARACEDYDHDYYDHNGALVLTLLKRSIIAHTPPQEVSEEGGSLRRPRSCTWCCCCMHGWLVEMWKIGVAVFLRVFLSGPGIHQSSSLIPSHPIPSSPILSIPSLCIYLCPFC